MSVSYIEFFLELLIFPSFKNSFNTFFLIAFLPLSLAGVFTRIGAFNSARSNFHHLIRYKRDPDHVLVKSGVYAYERHPGYLGYFVFSVSSQLMIKNPISSVIFTLVLWRFFLNRILDEEITLLKFFNGEYLDYKRDVGTHIPMIGKMVDLKLKFMGVKLKKDQ
jgi:protein-S-isoprenylcysteine O-methyltransferase